MSQDQPKAEEIPDHGIILLEFEENIGGELMNVVSHIQTHGSVVLKGPQITLQEIAEARALLKARDFHSYFVLGSFEFPSYIYMAAYPVTTQADLEQAQEEDFFAVDQARKREFFERVYRETRTENGDMSDAVEILGAGIRLDEEYRLGWVANLAQSFVMEGMEHYAAQEGAANFLDIFAHVDVRKDVHFQHRPEDHPCGTTKSQVNQIEAATCEEAMPSTPVDLTKILSEAQRIVDGKEPQTHAAELRLMFTLLTCHHLPQNKITTRLIDSEFGLMALFGKSANTNTLAHGPTFLNEDDKVRLSLLGRFLGIQVSFEP